MAEFTGANGFHLADIDADMKTILEIRDAFVKSYCEVRGWDISNLSFEQIMEIRSQDEWKNANPKYHD